MTKVEVETFESVAVLQRSLKTEAAVRSILLECAGAFSPRIEDRSVSGIFVCVVDVAGTEGLFGPPLMLAKQMRQRIRSVGVVASVTISANVHTSVCLARGLSGGVPLRIVPRGDEAKALAPMPVAVHIHTRNPNKSKSILWGAEIARYYTAASFAAPPREHINLRRDYIWDLHQKTTRGRPEGAPAGPP